VVHHAMTAAGVGQERQELRTLVSDARAAFLDHLPASCCADGSNALRLAVERFAVLSRGDTCRDHHLLTPDGVRRGGASTLTVPEGK
jgi:hypothetical protein